MGAGPIRIFLCGPSAARQDEDLFRRILSLQFIGTRQLGLPAGLARVSLESAEEGALGCLHSRCAAATWQPINRFEIRFGRSTNRVRWRGVWRVDFAALFTMNSKRSPYEKTCCLLRCARSLLRTFPPPNASCTHTHTHRAWGALTHALVCVRACACVLFAWRA